MVLFNNDLTSTAKLVFCLVSSLCASSGVCNAGNEAIGEKLGIGERTVSRLVLELEKKDYITCFYSRRVDGTTKREITLGSNDFYNRTPKMSTGKRRTNLS